MRIRRWGKFSISSLLLEERIDEFKAILSGVVITRAECTYHNGRIEYVGICEDFDEISEGEIIPEYTAELKHEDGVVRVSRWVRVRD